MEGPNIPTISQPVPLNEIDDDFCFPCKYCNSKFVFLSELRKHQCLVPIKNNTINMTSDTHDIIFLDHASLPGNKRKENINFMKGFLCEQCNKKYTTLYCLSKHMAKKHNSFQYHCDQCKENI